MTLTCQGNPIENIPSATVSTNQTSAVGGTTGISEKDVWLARLSDRDITFLRQSRRPFSRSVCHWNSWIECLTTRSRQVGIGSNRSNLKYRSELGQSSKVRQILTQYSALCLLLSQLCKGACLSGLLIQAHSQSEFWYSGSNQSLCGGHTPYILERKEIAHQLSRSEVMHKSLNAVFYLTVKTGALVCI